MTETLFVEVMHKESRGKNNSLGFSSMPLNDLTRGIEKQVWLQLEGGTQSSNIIGQIASHLVKKKDKVNNGKVFLGVTALDFGLDPSTYPPGSQMQQQQGQQQPGLQQPGLQQQQQPMSSQSPSQFEGQQQNYPQQQPGGMQQQQPGGMQQPMSGFEGQQQKFEGQQQNYPQYVENQQPGGMQQQQPEYQQQPGQSNIPQYQQQQGQPGMQYPPSSSYDPSGPTSQDVYPKTL